MQHIKLNIPDVLLIKPRIFSDERGFFTETYQQERYAQVGITGPFVQDNLSGSHKGILRGLHYQIQHPQGKLVQVIAGEIFDVVVDLRRNSATFGQWVGELLSDQNHNQLWVPPGFAHGFYVLSDWASVLYKTTDFYFPQAERTLRWDDPDVGIDWRLQAGFAPRLSEKDNAGKFLREAECFE